MKGNKKYNDETGSNVQVERLKEVSSNRYTVNQKKTTHIGAGRLKTPEGITPGRSESPTDSLVHNILTG